MVTRKLIELYGLKYEWEQRTGFSVKNPLRKKLEFLGDENFRMCSRKKDRFTKFKTNQTN